MAKTARTSATVQAKVENAGASGRGRKKRVQPDVELPRDLEFELDRMERLAAVCDLHCQGKTVKEIQAEMKRRFGIEMRREEPYTLISYAASRGWLHFRAPHHYEYSHLLRNRFGWLQDVDVVRTATTQDFASRAAEMLLRIVKDKVSAKKRDKKKDEVHIGFAGGVAIAHLASAFAELLCRPTRGLPEKIVLHAICAGFSPADPSTDPNAFFTYFLNKPLMQVETGFVGLHAPAIVNSADIDMIKKQREVKTAIDGVKDLDIIVTSGSDWEDEHSLLAGHMAKEDPDSFKQLKKLGVEGDVMWRPLAASGGIDATTKLRALTLMELEELQGFIDKRKGSVLLMMGPCGGCSKPKGRITRVVLEVPKSIITHLVVDSRSAAEMVRELGLYVD